MNRLILEPDDLTPPELRICGILSRRKVMLVNRFWHVRGAPWIAIHDRTPAALIAMRLVKFKPASEAEPAEIVLTEDGRDFNTRRARRRADALRFARQEA